MLKINSAAFYVCYPDWTWDTAATGWTDSDLWYISGGSGTIQTPSGTYKLKRGDLFFLMGRDRYIAGHDPQNPLQVYAVHFESLPSYEFARMSVRAPSFYDELCQRIVSCREMDDEKGALLWLKAALQEAEVSRRVEKCSISDWGYRISETIRYISEKEYGNVSVEDMADSFGSSREHFSRIFQLEKGMSPRAYLLSRKLNKARALLQTSCYSISVIAEQLGYCDTAFFSRQFKQKMGLSPSRFRAGDQTKDEMMGIEPI
ncbi:AraC family transcriptional regulator [Oceanispirochaeta sp.]|jgi:AraC family transcriptional regulator of arabinose operon|uniref:AraC family transcriptional regulator n=1 Tax=Oceanispirochaeta sp. TaxID=2035350 RepID=UPI00261C0F43|nr:AraC family transcriptional regulator [Oceanispirochaeta sp.]MDA3958185.1 AraC family transcriptional regulator [Oceanispirochaeta sp.]